MGFDTSLVLTRGAGFAGLENALGGRYRPSGKTVGFEEASAKKLGKAIAVATLDPWLVVWDPSLAILGQDGTITDLGTSGRAVGLLIGETSDTYSLLAAERARAVRLNVYTGGEAKESDGAPLPEETASEAPLSADRLFAMAERVLGLPLSSLHEARYEVWKPLSAPKGTAGEFYKRAQRFFKNDDEEKALSDARLACNAAPTDFAACALAATYADNLHHHEETLSFADRALAVDATSARLWLMRGETLVTLNRPEEALESFRRASAADPLGAVAWFEQAMCLLDLGREAEAREACAQALRVGPDVGVAYAERALRQFQPADAARVASRALRLLADADLEAMLAEALWKLNEPAEAMAASQRALALRPDAYFFYADPACVAARVSLQAGDHAAAFAYMARAVAHAPHRVRRLLKDAAFAPLAGDPRFEALAAQAAPR